MADALLNILVVDDEPAHAEAVRRAFLPMPDVTIVTVGSIAACREYVSERLPDLALVDLNLPDGRALQLLTSPAEDGGFPIVVMTSHGNEQTAVDAMKAGAIDYVVKSAEAFADIPRVIERARREWKLRQDRKRAVEALHESEERHRALFQKSNDALMTLAPPTWRFTSGNSAAFRLFGASHQAEFLSRTPWQYSPERQPDGRGSAEKAKELIDAAMLQGSLGFEWLHQRTSGEEFPATVVLTRIEIDGISQLQASVRDETEKRRLQARVAQADRLASMGMLAAGVAHEINNPLAYVLYNVDSLAQDLPRLSAVIQRCCRALRERLGDSVYAEIVQEDAELLEPSMLADAVERIREALEGTERIRAISRGLGTFSRVERADRTCIDLRTPLDAAINMAYNEIRHRARLVRDFCTVPSIWATEGKLSQVFLNLLVNAAHAIDEGDAKNNQITVRTWTEGSEACVAIADSGSGIPAENLERIFEPFFTTKSVGVGSGLGLSICRSIVLEFGGNLTVQSQAGKGTCFVVRLPAAKVASVQQSTESQPNVANASVVRGRVLIVDDEEAIRNSMVRLLGRHHELVTTASGAEAREWLARDRDFDIILCDLTMPQMAGTDLHAWLRDRDPDLANRLVFMTGGAFTPNVTEYLTRVENVRIEKPFDTADLERLVAELVIAAKRGRAKGDA